MDKTIFDLIEEVSIESVDAKLYDKIEKVSGISIPQDLRDYLDDYSKNVYDDPKFDGVDIVPLKESSKYNIFTEIKYHKEENGINFVPIEAVGNGDYVGVMDTGEIGVYNHENHKVKKVADTWTKYLQM